MFEKGIKIISRILTVAFMFLIADGFYLSRKGFVFENGQISLVKPAAAQTAPAPADIKGFNIDTPYILGNPDAEISIFEFSSLGCAHCADFHLSVLPKLRKDFIDTGKVKLIFADFPIDKKSMQAAMLARCMSEDKYFDFLSTLFKKQLSWSLSFKSEKLLAGYAEMEGLSQEKIQKCLNDDNTAAEIMYIRQQAMEKLDVKATPSFLIKKGDEGEMLTGVPSYDTLKEVLERKIND
ncbi:MAG: DsbA family protein [Alphaproteobacteria bacterium]|nr:DsbA family protein [Alphaproteobacteria bacterium]